MEQVTVAPVRVSVTVRAPLERAFTVFAEDIGAWWPHATHSIEAEKVTAVVMELRQEGRIFERHSDGREANWGVIRTWEPPHRLVFTWNPSYEARPDTEVEVRFVAVSDNETRVDLEHRNWEVLGEQALEYRDGYEQGWPPIMALYSERASED